VKNVICGVNIEFSTPALCPGIIRIILRQDENSFHGLPDFIHTNSRKNKDREIPLKALRVPDFITIRT
jgi:hypothetical protein